MSQINKSVPETQTFYKIINSFNPFSSIEIVSISGADVIFDKTYIEKKTKQRVYTSIETLLHEKEDYFNRNYNSDTLFRDIVINGLYNSFYFIFSNLFEALKLLFSSFFKLFLSPLLPFILILEYIKIKKYDIFFKNKKI